VDFPLTQNVNERWPDYLGSHVYKLVRKLMPKSLQATLALCAGVALEFFPPVTSARLIDKDKYLKPMFSDDCPARTNAAMLLMPIATTSSHTCTKRNVSCCIVYHVDLYFGFLSNLKRVEARK